jgi:hypothetical protein
MKIDGEFQDSADASSPCRAAMQQSSFAEVQMSFLSERLGHASS